MYYGFGKKRISIRCSKSYHPYKCCINKSGLLVLVFDVYAVMCVCSNINGCSVVCHFDRSAMEYLICINHFTLLSWFVTMICHRGRIGKQLFRRYSMEDKWKRNTQHNEDKRNSTTLLDMQKKNRYRTAMQRHGRKATSPLQRVG